MTQPPDLKRIFSNDALPTAETTEIETEDGIDLDAWLERDLKAVADAWAEVSSDVTSTKAANALRKAVHYFHGASGAYGGGALTRLTGSLHQLVSGVEDLHVEAALINLHVQACRATCFGDSAEDVADAVCEALEYQVGMRLIG